MLAHSTFCVTQISVRIEHLKSSHGSLQLQRPFKGQPFESRRNAPDRHVSSFSHFIWQLRAAKKYLDKTYKILNIQ